MNSYSKKKVAVKIDGIGENKDRQLVKDAEDMGTYRILKR